MTRGVKIFNKQNYLEDGVCEKHFIYSFAQFQFFFFWRGTYLSEISCLFSELQRQFFFSVRISFFKVVLLAFTYRL